jgi:hypothetical protein
VHQQPEFIHNTRLDEAPRESRAAMRQDRLSVLLLQLGNLVLDLKF